MVRDLGPLQGLGLLLKNFCIRGSLIAVKCAVDDLLIRFSTVNWSGHDLRYLGIFCITIKTDIPPPPRCSIQGFNQGQFLVSA